VSKHHAELHRIRHRFHVRRLELFGSAATGTERPGQSDLDFLVEFASLPPGTDADAYFGLLEALTGLYGRQVDLIEAESIENSYFRASIEQTKVQLFAP
jgi:predicted nucleotidyltransferase